MALSRNLTDICGFPVNHLLLNNANSLKTCQMK